MLTILSICDNAEVLSVLRIVKIVINIIKIAVPITLILTIMIELTGAVVSNDNDALKKATTAAVAKAIAAVCIFFIPNLVGIVVNIAGGDDTYKECLVNATTENIDRAFADRVSQLMDNAVENLSYATYSEAKRSLRKISDPVLKGQYEENLAELLLVLEAKDAIEIVRKSKEDSDYEKAVAAVEKITIESYKEELTEELEKIASTLNANMEEYSSDGYVSNPLGLPYYNQCDPRWKNIQYDMAGGCPNGPATPCCSACGYTSFSMIAAGFNRDMTITPYTVIQHMRAPLPTHRGYGAASVGELTDGSNLSFYKLKARSILSGSMENKKQQVVTSINSNHAIILLVPGHYIVLAPGTNGKIQVLDPFLNWGDRRRGNYERTVDEIYSIYGEFRWAAEYSRA